MAVTGDTAVWVAECRDTKMDSQSRLLWGSQDKGPQNEAVNQTGMGRWNRGIPCGTAQCREGAQTPQHAWTSVEGGHRPPSAKQPGRLVWGCHPPASYLSIWDMKRVSKVPRVLSFSEASPLKSRFSSTSFSSTSRTISPMYFPPIIFSYLGGGIGQGGHQSWDVRGHIPQHPLFPRPAPCWMCSCARARPGAKRTRAGAEPSVARGTGGRPEELDLSYSLQLLTGVK